jgi:ribosome-binding protein aMBF1 (putative translation factor)
MYQPEHKPTVAAYLLERGIGSAPETDPRQSREDQRQADLRAKGEAVRRWREYATTTTPSTSTKNLRAVREACGLSLGDVSEIVGQHPSLVEAAEAGKVTLADDALRSFVGAATTALLAHEDGAA